MGQVDTKAKRRKRWPEALKREIVAASRMPGASVSKVARQYDVNANQVFTWRRRYRCASEPPALQPPPSTPALVPVTITSEPEEAPVAPPAMPAESAPATIEIELPDGWRVRVGSGFDGRTLKRVLDVLSRTASVREKSR
jgi:transposase